MLGSVRNALRTLELLSEQPEVGVSEIGRSLGVTPATAHRLVNTLVAAGFAERDPESRRYRLGTKVLVIASRLREQSGLRDLLLPALQTLAQDTGETVNLAVYREGEVIYLERINDSSQIVHLHIDVGSHVPAYTTALGKTLLAFRAPQEVRQYLDSAKLVAYTSLTITSAAKLSIELERIRKRGYALDRGELLEDVCCVAAPVSVNRGPAAAISVSAPRSRFEKRREELISLVVEAAKKASAMVEDFEDLKF